MLMIYHCRMNHRDTALSRVETLTTDIAAAETARDREIARAVYHGATWAQIAAVLGVTAQSAHRKYRWFRWSPTEQVLWWDAPRPSKR